MPVASTNQKYTVYISGQAVFVIAGSLTFSRSVGRVAQASFSLHTSTAVQLQQYQPVTIYDQTNTLVFSGFIDQPKAQKPGFQSSLNYTVTCINNLFLASKRRVAASYTNKTCGYIVQDIVTNILAAEGVTIGQIYDGLTPSLTLYPSTTLYPSGNVGLIPQATFLYCKVSEALDALVQAASASGVPYYWMIDEQKRLWFVPYGTTVNSTVLDGSTIDHIFNPPTWIRANPTYRNQQIELGGVSQTVAQTKTGHGDGEKTTWTMDFDLYSLTGASVNSMTKTFGIKGIDTGKDFYWQQGSPDITQDSGATKLTSSDLWEFDYIGQYPAVVISSNAAQIAYQASIDGTSGIIEDLDVDNTLISVDNSLAKASQLLTRYAMQGGQLTFYTLNNSYAPGQLVTAALSAFNLNNVQLLVTNVVASDQTDAYNIWYQVSAIQGPYDVNWDQFFSKMLKQQAPANSINIGSTTTTGILQQFTAGLTMSATLNTIVTACPLPSTSLFPSTTLYPC